MDKKTKRIIWIVVAVAAVALIGFLLTDVMGSAQEIDLNQLINKIANGEVNVLHIDGYNWTAIREVNGKVVETYKTIGPSLYDYVSYNEFMAQVGLSNPAIQVQFTDPNAGSIWSSLFPLIGVVLVALMFWLMMRNASNAGNVNMSINKSKTQVQNNLKVRFSDVAGAEEEKEELQEVVEFLKAPKKFSNLGARIPSGVLLVGPPGTGKTLFAKAVAGEAGVPFFSISGSDFVEMYVGVGAKRVRDLFDMAKKSQPCIIFIDEIDAVGRRRGSGLGGGHDEREQTLNQILVQMDGFESNDGIIVMAATNREDVLDPALLRPGRFDRRIHVNLPDVKGREQILKVHARNKPMAADVNFKTVARITAGFSGAELANLLNEAAILAARAGKKVIGNIELYNSFNKVQMGPQKRSHVVTESDKRCTAYHEAGHAVIAELCKNCSPVHEVSIIPRGSAAGYTMTSPETDDNDVSYNKLIDQICKTLGGRVAEELVIQDVTTGASHDLQVVSDIARRMVKQWGMSEKLGLVAYDSDQPVFVGMEYGHSDSKYSQVTAALIDEEVRRLISEAHARATKLLQENRSILDNMSRVLVEKETIYKEEVQMLMRGASYQEVIDFMDSTAEQHDENPFAFAVNNTEEKKDETADVSENAENIETAEPIENVAEETVEISEETEEISEEVTEENATENTENSENQDE